jgi:hypothetical protein
MLTKRKNKTKQNKTKQKFIYLHSHLKRLSFVNITTLHVDRQVFISSI